ncbi:DUF927 domain-containing protein [Psychrobacter sp. LFX-11D]|uniref:DUF927 domain-containing protein n=1 Tax=Psychrobacter sp. LFX-11D TaxID=458201 RepID=UPI001919732C|nr:DUF927 domain-containing protein [Psychrobacter sp. LFX-11D]
MTTSKQTNSQEKARAVNTGTDNILQGYKPAKKEQLAGDPFLIKLYDMLEPERLLSVTDNTTIYHGDEVGKTKPTAGTIALTITDKQGQTVGAIFFKPNSKDKPVVIDPTGYGAIFMGNTDPNSEVIAFDNIADMVDAYIAAIGHDKTLIASTSKQKQIFKQTVHHWSSTRRVVVPMTLDDKGKKALLAGVKAQALITTADIVTMLQANESYEYIKEQANIIELSDTVRYPEWRKDRAPQLNEPMICADGRFELYHDGLFFVKYDKSDPSNILYKQKMFVCSPIEVIAKTRDASSETWGRLLQWHDADGVLHKWAMPAEMLQGDVRDYRRKLASFGLNITTNARQRSYLDTYIQDYPAYTRGLCVDKLGWHDDQYILPDRSFGGDGKELIVYQSTHAANNALARKGSLDQWRDELCRPLADQSRLVFSISCAFAGQLLEPLGIDSGGFHIVGSSSMGKSVSLKAAASVWGHPDKYVKTWRQTDNALEGTACEHNDSFLGLDEISECDPKIIGKTSYMLANGQGKGRSTVSGHNRKSSTWRLMFLSNGENTIEQHMALAGQKTNAGIEIRVAHIDADAGKGYRMFDSLVLADTGEAQADKIKALSATYYGTAGIAWLEYITKDKAMITTEAQVWIDEFMSSYPDIKAQAYRVGIRFALGAAAGEMATKAGITGWQKGQALSAAQICFDNWLNNYGRGGEHEQRQIIKHIQAFIEQHGSSRFEPRHSQRCPDFEPRTSNRVGYRNTNTGDYYFLMNTFEMEICPPFNTKKVLQVLDDAGLLMRNQGDRKAYKAPKTLFIERDPFYAVKSHILSYETDKSMGLRD